MSDVTRTVMGMGDISLIVYKNKRLYTIYVVTCVTVRADENEENNKLI